MFTKNKNVLADKQGDKLVLYNLDTGDFFETSNVGTYVWEKLSCQDIDSIADKISKKFDFGDKDEIKKDLSEFINDLKKNNLIHEA